MKNIIVGTAGHIDHGKSALVRALTGIEPDRWEEERRRGISIDLGFAHLGLDGVRVAFVDVPGHERFVKNMLAGAGGIDLVVLVIAADEGVMPQTREHFDICRLLGVQAGIVAITKCDLADSDTLELVKLEAEEFVRGSFLDGAPIVGVSVKTGAGLDEFKRELQAAGRRVGAKDASRHLRLPIDRSFTLRGFGTVVTGTLVGGSIAVDDEVEVHPLGRRLRVRGVQVHGEAVERADAGQRTAVNLAGVEAEELHRGMTLGTPGVLRATRRIDCEIELLPDARPPKHGASVHFHAWTAETQAQVRWLDTALARLILREPVVLLPGDRFILRTLSPVATIGGGMVVDVDGPQRLRRSALAARARSLLDSTSEARVSLLVKEAKFGLPRAEIVARTGMLGREIGGDDWLLDPAWLAGRQAALEKLLAEFHRRNPLAPGMPREEAKARVLGQAPALVGNRLLEGLQSVALDGEFLRLASYRLALKDDEAEALEKIEQTFERGGLAVPGLGEVLKTCGVEASRARGLLQILLRQRRLVKAGDDLVYHASALAKLRESLSGRKGQRFSVGDFKEWTGVSRKYAIPLLEYLDRERITRREGDLRFVI